MEEALFNNLYTLGKIAPQNWLTNLIHLLTNAPISSCTDDIQRQIPETNNTDLIFLTSDIIKVAKEIMSWEALGWCIVTLTQCNQKNHLDSYLELLWSIPSPNKQLIGRRIDQSLYELIDNASYEILLVTFAAAKISTLVDKLKKAIERNVKVCLILEFSKSSKGQLSFDALKAFPNELIKNAEIYFWPTNHRSFNQAGNPGKLHAKIAVIDNTIILSSANLTDDAFNRNLELGVLIKNEIFLNKTRQYIESLMLNQLIRVDSKAIN
jgi:phosphatidylserine/phosphatidylglycerophosphate/cardiolipin synthase-like enzyme